MEYVVMGKVVKEKIKEFMGGGLSKKEARIKAHEYCKTNSLCRCCDQTITPDYWSRLEGYCLTCGWS